MDDNGLPDWTFAFLEAEWRVCDWRFEDRVTCVGRAHAVDGKEAQVADAILHKIAHAITCPKSRPGPSWKATLMRHVGPRART